MASKWIPLLISLLLLGWSLPGQAFGPSGHRLAGHIAEQYLCAETRAALKPLLASQGVTGPGLKSHSLAEAGLWPDTIRRLPEWEHTKPWHYLNVSDDGSIEGAARKNPDNVLSALADFEQELGDKANSRQARSLALRFVAHFVVDLHQPLHVGRAADRGGNLIPVLIGDRETNLHAVWDGEPLRTPDDPDPLQTSRPLVLPRAMEVLRWQRASPLVWARESQALRAEVYDFPRTDRGPGAELGPDSRPVSLSPAYLAHARALLGRRLTQAGIRLAGRLNAILGPPAGCGPEIAARVATR